MVGLKAWTLAGALAFSALTPSGWALAQNTHKDSGETKAVVEGPPLAGFSEAEVAAFFTLFSANGEFDAEIGPMIDEMFEPGEAVVDWHKTGVDILAVLSAKKGGIAANLLRDSDPKFPSVTDLSGTAAPDLAGFETYKLRAKPPGPIDERVFASFSPGVWIEMAFQRTMQGNAMCYSGLVGLTLHSRRRVTEWEEDELFLAAALVSVSDRVASRAVCVVYEREGEKFLMRSFLPDGRRLPKVDADSAPLEVMRASTLPKFLRDTVPIKPAEQER